MKLNILLFISFITLNPLSAQRSWTIADRAFKAWETGESTGNYTAFRQLMAPGFHTFAHPLRTDGKPTQLSGATARQHMEALMQARTANPNQLRFRNVVASYGDSTAVFQFDSEGTLAGGYPYRGYNVIALTIRGGQVVGFQEYFGDIDPLWFQTK